MRIQSITVGKTRSIKQGKLREVWCKSEITATFREEEEPTAKNIDDLLDEVEKILIQQEELERSHWEKLTDSHHRGIVKTKEGIDGKTKV